MTIKTSKKFYKPAPYLVQQDSYPVRAEAEWLRNTFGTLLARRLPTLIYAGCRHGYIPTLVQQYKKEYGYYLRADVERFYPTVQHQELQVAAQLAYRDLLGLAFVPSGFKKRFLPGSGSFFASLPVAGRGLPLNSAYSKAIAPLIWVPFLLQVRKVYDVRFIVYADDILLLTRTAADSTAIYHQLCNYLHEVGLRLNAAKVQQGRFAGSEVSFCGYSFAGGYVGVDAGKVEAFEQNLTACMAALPPTATARCVIKRVNQRVCGFGHYYKCGAVGKLYTKLDARVRHAVRLWLRQHKGISYTNAQLTAMGLFSFSALLSGRPQRVASPAAIGAITAKRLPPATPLRQPDRRIAAMLAYMEKLTMQNKQMINLMTKQIEITQRLMVG